MNIKKWAWSGLGFLSLGVAYLGVILPGIPFSIPAVFAAYCFAKSSTKMHFWLYNHKLFGPFLNNWESKKVFPQKAKYAMVSMMLFSLALMWFTTGNLKAMLYSGTFMALGAVWGWRYPSTPEEYDRRKAAGERIGLFK